MVPIKYFLIHIFFVFFSIAGIAQINQHHADGTRHGLWEKKFKGTEQVRYIGRFNHGVEVGQFKFYKRGFSSQPSAIKTFSDNGKIADLVYYSQGGNVISRGRLVDRKREGEWLHYHKNSKQVLTREYYKDNELDGIQTTYYDNGHVAETIEYLSGKKNGKQLVYSVKDILIKEFTYQNNVLEGLNRFYSGRGNLIIEGNYHNDKKVGTWKYYENKKLVREKVYK